MILEPSVVLAVGDESGVGEARRAAAALTSRFGFGDEAAGKVAVMVTEAARNLHLHAGGGTLALTAHEHGGVPAVDLFSLDNGKGMADVDRCLADGFSTAGTAGQGLGAIRRMADVFDLWSEPGHGTVLFARRYASEQRRWPGFDLGAICAPYPGEVVCGDAWLAQGGFDRLQLMVVDGLGHGPTAHEAARTALECFTARPQLEPGAQMGECHAALRATRGGAGAMAEADFATGKVRYSGIGNISGMVLLAGGESKHLVSHNGILGHNAGRIQQFEYPLPEGGTLVMYSDGIRPPKLHDREHLERRHPAIAAGLAFRDGRRKDDATVVAARQAKEAGTWR